MVEVDLAERFEHDRARLRGIAYRMLGSTSEADDAVQEAWLKVSRADTGDVDNLSGWLTTVVARVCLDMLRTRRSRPEEPAGDHVPESRYPSGVQDPEQEALLADAIGPALLVVLDALAPAERLAFVLHDMFAVPYDRIAEIVGCSSAAARQHASRARRRVQGSAPDADPTRQREVVDAFLAASRNGDFDGLLRLLDPDVVLRADRAAVEMGAEEGARGAKAVAETFSGRARVARTALLGGSVGAVWAQGGEAKVAFGFTISDGRIIEVSLIADPEELHRLDPTILVD